MSAVLSLASGSSLHLSAVSGAETKAERLTVSRRAIQKAASRRLSLLDFWVALLWLTISLLSLEFLPETGLRGTTFKRRRHLF